jgi:hypothetical protein
MRGKFFLGWIVAFVLWMAGGFIVHGTLLAKEYMALTSLFRAPADAEAHFPLMILAHIIAAGAFVWIYSRGIEPKPWLAQGIRYGIAVAFLTAIPTYMIYYVVQPMPGSLAVRQAIYDTICLVIVGIATAWVYRNETARA